MAKAVATLVVVAALSAGWASADICNPGNLYQCLPAIVNGSEPTTPCCANLSGQKNCFCQYVHDPDLSQYVNSPYIDKVLTTCGVAIPNC